MISDTFLIGLHLEVPAVLIQFEKISKGIWCLLSEKFYFLFLPANSESKDVCEVFPEIPYSVGPEKTDSPCFQVVQRFYLFRKAQGKLEEVPEFMGQGADVLRPQVNFPV